MKLLYVFTLTILTTFGATFLHQKPYDYESKISQMESRTDSLLQAYYKKQAEKDTLLKRYEELEEAKILSTPCVGCVVTSKFKTRKRPNHTGIDLDIIDSTNLYTPYVRAVQDGLIRHKVMSGYGKIAIIEHSKYRKTRYAHLREFVVKDSVQVKKGEPIGLMGNSGASKGKHLHFEMLERKDTLAPFRPVNPLKNKIYIDPIDLDNYATDANSDGSGY